MSKQEEQELDRQTAEDMQSIANMITAADECSLLIEVIWSYGNSSTVDIPAKCRYALNEWDC